jgi:glycosyl-4,4'-diaponeurosporenoate acyltransferase
MWVDYGAGRNRTDDNQIANLTLYQLSYSPVENQRNYIYRETPIISRGLVLNEFRGERDGFDGELFAQMRGIVVSKPTGTKFPAPKRAERLGERLGKLVANGNDRLLRPAFLGEIDPEEQQGTFHQTTLVAVSTGAMHPHRGFPQLRLKLHAVQIGQHPQRGAGAIPIVDVIGIMHLFRNGRLSHTIKIRKGKTNGKLPIRTVSRIVLEGGRLMPDVKDILLLIKPSLQVFCFIVLTQFAASLVVDHMDEKSLERWRQILHSHNWEKNGDVYQQFFDVKKWKDRLPEMGDNSPNQFRKTRMNTTDPMYLYIFILETVRAEMCHGLAFIFGILVLMNNPTVPGLFFLLLYITLVNVPFVIIQRFNRPRLERLLEHIVKSHQGVLIPKESLYT